MNIAELGDTIVVEYTLDGNAVNWSATVQSISGETAMVPSIYVLPDYIDVATDAGLFLEYMNDQWAMHTAGSYVNVTILNMTRFGEKLDAVC